MQHMNRRSMFKLAGAGSAMVAGAALPVVGRLATEQANRFGFKATLGLPEPPLPSYATHLVEGTVDLRTADVEHRREHPPDKLAVHGIVEDRSQLQPGESPQVELLIDRRRGVVHAPFADRSVTLSIG